MGHSEMLLAVAGLDQEQIDARTKKIASGDWSDFSPAEAIAFSFALRLTKNPSEISTKDVERLREVFGPERAMDVIWYVAWCNYMTRVADALQLPLETENVFAQPQVK